MGEVSKKDVLCTTVRPYVVGDVVHFSSYVRPTTIMTGKIERIHDSIDFDRDGVRVKIFSVREDRSQQLCLTSHDLIYGFVYS